MSGPLPRDQAMSASVARALRSVGAGSDEARGVLHAIDAAMTPRLAALDDDHHPAYLHPGRTVLVILRDVGWVGAEAVTVAALLESEDEALRVAPDEVAPGWAELVGRSTVPHDEGNSVPDWDLIAGRLAEAPGPGDDRLMERLVGLPHDVAIAVLAERLDQLRHLHVRSDLKNRWAARLDETRRVWLPLAESRHELLGRRFGHWVRTFARRVESGDA